MNMEALTSKIPDVYFDWYARFLPGSIGVIAYFLITDTSFENLSSSLVLYGFISYLVGHVVQPPVGFIVKQLEIKISNGTEEKYKIVKKNK